MWRLNAISEDEIMDECGMDALCVLRLLWMGFKICALSAVNAIWLMPLYALSPEDDETRGIVDPVVQLTVGNVPAGSARFIGTVLAAYILFGYVMHQVILEFEWFIQKRHEYLKKPVVENYSIYVRNVPPQYRSNEELQNYFASCYSNAAVLETKVRIKAPKLIAAVKRRDALVKKLEHALNYELVKRQQPMHREKSLLGGRVPSIPSYARALREANQTVTELIENIEQSTMGETPAADESQPLISAHTSTLLDEESSPELQSDAETRLLQSTAEDAEDDRRSSRGPLSNLGMGKIAAKSLSATKILATSASKIIMPTKEGDYLSAGFVTFSSLGVTHAARQMVHHGKPFDIEVVEAPRPDDIFWRNVGRTHKDLQLGNLASLAATTAVCFLWTIPMTFLASLSSVEALRTKVPFLDDLIDRFPFLSRFFEIVAPLLVKVVNGLLPTILTHLTLLEGPVSSSVVVASLFTKLATFMIVQTFFVSAVGSSLLKGKRQRFGRLPFPPYSAVQLYACLCQKLKIFWTTLVPLLIFLPDLYRLRFVVENCDVQQYFSVSTAKLLIACIRFIRPRISYK
jgi:calcium permeable stress-gated cation channel